MPRHRLTISALALIFSCVLFAGWLGPSDSRESLSATAKSDASLSSLRGDKAIESLKQRGLYDSLQQAMAATRYGVSLESKSNDSQVLYRAPNPAQGFDALFNRQGISIQPRAAVNQAVSWQTALRLVGYDMRTIL